MIRVEQLSKRFRFYRTPADRLKELVLRRCYHTDHQALEDVSFEVHDGQAVGIIGQNGAGKSTLLKILTGVMLPDSGIVQVSGKVTGLIELGTGFNGELSGFDNISANGVLLGMRGDEIEARRADIVEFAELADRIHEPLKTYSSGMIMRLAFAVAIHADPKCFVVDEALSVGDAYFQQKCMRAVQDFRALGGSILFVSHDMSAVKSLCDHALLLDGGRIIDRGKPKDVVDHYHAMTLRRTHVGDVPVSVVRPAPPSKEAPGSSRAPLAGTGEVELVSLLIRDATGAVVEHVTSEEQVTIVARVRTHRALDQPHYGIGIRNRFGHSVFETNTYCAGIATEPLPAGQTAEVAWQFKANIIAGDYSVTVGVGNRPYGTGSFEEILYFAHDLAMLKVEMNPRAIRYDGYLNLHPEVSITQGAPEEIGAPSGSASVRDAYTAHYYLTDCGGYETYREHGGKRLDLRLDCMARLAAIHPAPRRVLDLGCGRGEVARRFAALDCEVDAVDYSADAIRLAEACFHDEPELRSRVRLKCASVTDSEVYQGKYDVVFASDLVEHLAPHELDGVYALVHRHLADDGVFLIHTFPNSWFYRYAYPLRRRKAAMLGEILPVQPRSPYELQMHINEQSPRVLRRQLQEHFGHVLLWAGDHEDPAGSLGRRFGKSGWRDARSLFAVAARQPVSSAHVVETLQKAPA